MLSRPADQATSTLPGESFEAMIDQTVETGIGADPRETAAVIVRHNSSSAARKAVVIFTVRPRFKVADKGTEAGRKARFRDSAARRMRAI
ncbi:hypothetical protein D3C87_1926260 [compost metagenome]